jgi:WD40 repeat protein
MRAGSGEGPGVLYQGDAVASPSGMVMAPDGSFVVVHNVFGQVTVVSLTGAPPRQLAGFSDMIRSTVVGPDSRLVAAGSGAYLGEEALVRIWDLHSDEVRIVDAGDGVEISDLVFSETGDLWVRSGSSWRRWILAGEEARMADEVDLSESPSSSGQWCSCDPEAGTIVFWRDDRLWREDFRTKVVEELDSCPGPVTWCGLTDDGEIVVTGSGRGGFRVGRLGETKYHLLLGRAGGGVAVSPDYRWIASGGPDSTIVLWPMPDLATQPLETLPRSELIQSLEGRTNLRVVQDEASPSGWKLEVEPLPGWQAVPAW